MSGKTLFLKLTNEPDKATALKSALSDESSPLRYEVEASSFEMVPGSPFAYWISQNIRMIFKQFNQFATLNRDAQSGASTMDDFRFIRAWWENSPMDIGTSRASTLDNKKWVYLLKGGAYSTYYQSPYLTINWKNDGKTIKERVSEYRGSKGWGYQWTAALNGHSEYFRPGLTWPRRTTSGLGMRAMPVGCIFGDKGPAAFIKDDSNISLLSLLSIVNSPAFRGLVAIQLAAADAAARSYEVGIIERTPVPETSEEDEAYTANLAHDIWKLKQKCDETEENSLVFKIPALLMTNEVTWTERSIAWNKILQECEAEIKLIQSKIDEKCWQLYGVSEADRPALMDSAVISAEPANDEVSPDEVEEIVSVTSDSLAEGLVSWLFGVALGRWDEGLAASDTSVPPLPDPFDPLPSVSRGMLKGSDGVHPARNTDGRFSPSHDLLLDDEGASLDLMRRLLEVLERIVGKEHIEARVQELERMLGSDLRTWFRSSFFERHLKRYSKSRRKAPIYWQLGTPSASYSVWLYYPRLTRDSLYRVLNEVVKPKVTFEEQRLTEMRGEGATRRQIEIQEGFVEELRTFREEVTRVAPLWNPDLDDGVLLNFAPLWRLTPHPGWRRDTKAAWDGLAKGDFDWARLAMKLWPERVIPKCARERHLALAHDLEASLQSTPVEELVRVGTSPAVKDALQSLLTAPALGGSARAPRAATPRRAAPTEEPAPAPTPRSRGMVSEETLAAIQEALVRFPQGAAKADVLEATNLTDAAWNTAIQVLLDRGEAERRGEKRGARYFLKTLER